MKRLAIFTALALCAQFPLSAQSVSISGPTNIYRLTATYRTASGSISYRAITWENTCNLRVTPVAGVSYNRSVDLSGTVESPACSVTASVTVSGRVIKSSPWPVKVTSEVRFVVSTRSVGAPVVVAVRICPKAVTVQPGGTQQFSGVATLSDGTTTTQGIRYGANIGTITASGLWTAPAGTDTVQHGYVWAEVDGIRSRMDSCV